MIQTDAEDASRHLTDLIEAAARGEEMVISSEGRGGKQMVRLVTVQSPPRRPRFGSAQGMIVISEDFDAPLHDFHEYQ